LVVCYLDAVVVVVIVVAIATVVLVRNGLEAKQREFSLISHISRAPKVSQSHQTSAK
jgi:hypothetical protein